MTTDELEQILEASTETPALDFKSSHPWSEQEYAKDFMAMANIDGGGRIIVGVDESDDGYIKTGIKPEDKRTYSYDVMKDQISKYTDPFVDFSVDYPKDNDGKEYVVVTIQPFRDVPVICKKNSTDLHEAVIYYRTNCKRPQSTPIANYHDLRELLERSAIKIMHRFEIIGLKTKKSVRDVMKRERGDL